uniref:Protein kinase domain-containing protein n=1 Tax=Macrostomum lignano TaxID=282301 RepID=A0A1I8J0Y0_9PLAT
MLIADSPWTPVQAEKCILYLLHLGADAKVTDRARDTAAHLAARRDHVRLLALLPFHAKWLPNQQGATPLMEAVKSGSRRCAKHLLHLLRQRRLSECSERKNSKREKLLSAKNVDGRTALDIALKNKNSQLAGDIVREMYLTLDQNGLISGLSAQDLTAREELEQLAKTGDFARLQQAVTRCSCDLPDRIGATILMREAVFSNSEDSELWKQLLREGDPTCADVWAASCVHWAASGGHSSAVRDLLDAGASVNIRGPNGNTALMFAAVLAPPAKAAEVSRTLLKAGCDWSMKNWKGQTALALAEMNDRSELAQLLEEYEKRKFFDEPLQLPPPYRESWTVKRLIGSGGCGTVHDVVTDIGVRCVAKTLRLPMQHGDEQGTVRANVKKAINSERNLLQLKHDNIVKFLHIAHTGPSKVVVFMELLEGFSMERFLGGKPIAEVKIRKFISQICSALDYMHSQQPPGHQLRNIIVLADNTRIKLIDFGLSIKLEESVSHYSASAATPKGTLNFMAPELVAPGRFSQTKLTVQLDRNGAPDLPDGCSAKLKDFYSCCTQRNRKMRKSASELMQHKFLT